jgi:hypothetical protein
MNTIDKNQDWLDDPLRDDARFDRLADGELSPEEYRALVSGLDEEPGGWRRCALAFLEAQALSGELASIRRCGQLSESPIAPLAQPVRRPAKAAARQAGRPVNLSNWLLILGMAASFLLTFVVGTTVPGLWKPAPGGGNQDGGNLAADSVTAEPGQAMPDGLLRTVGNAQVWIEGPGGTQSSAGEVPIFELPAGASGEWLGQPEPVLPMDLINELERRGHRVERHEQYVPVNLEDGREGVIPVERYQITPVSRRAY